MTNEWISDQLKIAKEGLDKVTEIGEVGYNICDGILGNLKSFITDPTIYETVTKFEEKLYKDFKQKEIDARLKLKDIDALTSFNAGLQYYNNLRRWRSTELLNMWTRLVKDAEL